MKKTDKTKTVKNNELKEEYSFDYSTACKNRYADLLSKGQVLFPIDKEVVKEFKTPEKVNNVLKAIIGVYS
jgi:hypothetical protein